MFGFNKPNLEETLFQLKFSGKQIDRFAKKAEKDQLIEQGKVKKALLQKNIEGAKIYAENAIRKKNECLNYMRLSSKLDAVSSRIQTAITMKQVTHGIQNVTKDLEKAMASMDLEKIDKIMSKFESQFEDLDVRTSTVENAMGNAVTLSAPEDQVNSLIKQVAEENGLEVMSNLTNLKLNEGSVVSGSRSSEREPAKEDDLTRRLAALRQ